MSILVAYKYAANPQDASVDASGVVDWSRAKAAISEYDPVAVQVGRDLADSLGTELVGISVGSCAVSSSMAKKGALSRGMDRALVVAEDETATWNATRVASALAGLVAKAGDVSLVLAGDSSVDESAKIVPTLLAGFLGWPCFQEVTAVTGGDGQWSITQSVAGGTRTVSITGPVVVAVATDAAPVKVPGMKDILAAGKKPLEVVPAADLDLAEVTLETTGRAKPVAETRRNEVFSGDDAPAQLVQALRNAGAL
ncbi:electron transfer flavoprotein beta subunit/FixA family protein [Schaalia sp. 19OD2882]|uniref:electron transfer flavoprotein subunit beta/FixA family protein n=1 Tax=Schaalia sp. 19OD2882 TaxID=2794089 RepID=UPI001C1F176B|nr:electron transfer flavoprotein beta subunit/FixA family protein [Schaalia sp. 19OD2882]QWW18970.1 electron transfer flavoprotein beta subunit/FixA family protein [Schaalia sp. 19OD2882]